MKRIGWLFLLAALTGCAANPPGTPGGARTEVCKPIADAEIAALFDRWNLALKSGDPRALVALYAERSVLLPTLSNKPRVTPEEKEDYFRHFLANKPSGHIDFRRAQVGCNSLVDAGLYTFTYGTTGAQIKGRYSYTYDWNGTDWLISSHHSSVMPEKTP